MDERLKGYLEQAIAIIAAMGMTIEGLERGAVTVRLPKAKNVNHIGTVYAGSLFSLADFTGGVLFYSAFDPGRFFPILREATIRFLRPATTDMFCSAAVTPEEAAALAEKAAAEGKADWDLELELKDEAGNVCCTVTGRFQIRRSKL
ncbi:MAG TPA: YiiD C-terminal domain-containing protein [Syntrophales bacterium]|nr:YiiD C-terminal domain-containing protein [Syntrophales bacterium]HOM06634.1 YiiD C-terminal domain-containing protein [Syntrophales bacterium]HON99784.1 YiiD C-terminal domain-containing protein [Syntrophales bacterium]HPC01138.1 YiiD C-terminal domain-containing protein [Syntrophales bacterium]HPQ06295.1 YiiD C-terminal domain-containing protein [Syntrophales bacterium]